MRSALNHVAYLVESIEATLSNNSFSAEDVGEIEEFPSEGTRELYIGQESQMGKLLFMQAIGSGPYKTALDKRGPGLHHIAIDVEDIDEFVGKLDGSGWHLHPQSLSFYKNDKLIYLCRSATPVLIEVQQRKKLVDGDYFIERMEFPFPSDGLLDAVRCDRLAMGKATRLLDSQGADICRI